MSKAEYRKAKISNRQQLTARRKGKGDWNEWYAKT
jgi:hypothetical protein